MHDELPCELQKTLLGKTLVKYSCPSCLEKLESEFSAAGTKDDCPSCFTSFIVPGISKRKVIEAELAKIEEQRSFKNEQDANRAHSEKSATSEKVEAEKLRKVKADHETKEHLERIRIAQQKLRLAEFKDHSGYVYLVEYFNPTVENNSQTLTDFLNHFSAKGWEYHRLDILTTYRPAGCFASLLGMRGDFLTHHLATFRKFVGKPKSDFESVI